MFFHKNHSIVLSNFVPLVNSCRNIKINQQEISTIITALERYGHNIKASFTEDEFEDNLKDRYDQLMNYLNV